MYDGNGNVGQMVDGDDGALEAFYEYDPYGNLIKAEGAYAAVNPFRFSTKYFEGEAGLYYYGYRYYSPELGRWVSKDPIKEKGGLNLYAFVKNDSINYIDPFGKWKWKDGKRQGGSRATVIAEKAKDPYNALANLVGLSVSEVKLWLKTWKKNEKVCKGEEFTVPNTFVIANGDSGDGISSGPLYFFHALWIESIAQALEKRGFLVDLYDAEFNASIATVTSATRNENTWGYSFFGHGAKFKDPQYSNMNGTFVWRDNDRILPYKIKRKFKYGLGINYHCFADKQNWDSLSLSYYGATDYSHPAAGAVTIGWYSSWDSLIGSVTD